VGYFGIESTCKRETLPFSHREIATTKLQKCIHFLLKKKAEERKNEKVEKEGMEKT
jgi:hypothetical protein